MPHVTCSCVESVQEDGLFPLTLNVQLHHG
jgi:hypothetical protein